MSYTPICSPIGLTLLSYAVHFDWTDAPLLSILGVSRNLLSHPSLNILIHQYQRNFMYIKLIVVLWFWNLYLLLSPVGILDNLIHLHLPIICFMPTLWCQAFIINTLFPPFHAIQLPYFQSFMITPPFKTSSYTCEHSLDFLKSINYLLLSLDFILDKSILIYFLWMKTR